VFINVLDPTVHKKVIAATDLNLVNGAINIKQDGILLGTLVVKLTSAGAALTKNTDYTAAFDEDGYLGTGDEYDAYCIQTNTESDWSVLVPVQ
jgi:hypothetical protein